MRDVNSLNKVILIGHLGGNPEVRYIPQSERAVANFTLATNEKIFHPGSGESEDRTEWHRIVVWGKLAEFCEKYLTRGKQICLEGKIRTREWEDRDGNKRKTTEIIAYSIVLLGRRDEGPSNTNYSDHGTGPSDDSIDERTSIPDKAEDDDEIPF
jgi:single-strand DNA-binding protein